MSVDARPEAATRSAMLESGLSRRELAGLVAKGAVIRARRDRYVPASAPNDILRAVRIGGRVTCLSLLKLLGVFVFSCTALHVQIPRGSARLRSATDARKRLKARAARTEMLHWTPLVRPGEASAARVAVVDALVCAIRCQQPRHAIATLDSALNKGLIRVRDLADIFGALPARFASLRCLVDGRAQSGPETLVRLMVRSLGCAVELQRKFDGVGFVDLVVDGWLVVECDSKAFHATWEEQLADRRRDRMLAKQGYAVLRLTAEEIMYQPEVVLAALRGLIHAHGAGR